jgi:hypothetical protein
MIAQYALSRGSDALDGILGSDIQVVGLELHANHLQRLKSVA